MQLVRVSLLAAMESAFLFLELMFVYFVVKDAGKHAVLRQLWPADESAATRTTAAAAPSWAVVSLHLASNAAVVIYTLYRFGARFPRIGTDWKALASRLGLGDDRCGCRRRRRAESSSSSSSSSGAGVLVSGLALAALVLNLLCVLLFAAWQRQTGRWIYSLDNFYTTRAGVSVMPDSPLSTEAGAENPAPAAAVGDMLRFDWFSLVERMVCAPLREELWFRGLIFCVFFNRFCEHADNVAADAKKGRLAAQQEEPGSRRLKKKKKKMKKQQQQQQQQNVSHAADEDEKEKGAEASEEKKRGEMAAEQDSAGKAEATDGTPQRRKTKAVAKRAEEEEEEEENEEEHEEEEETASRATAARYAVFASSALFGAVHLLNLLGRRYSLAYVCAQVPLGLVIGAFYCSLFSLHRSLLECVLLHAVNNLFACLMPFALSPAQMNDLVGPYAVTTVVFALLLARALRQLRERTVGREKGEWLLPLLFKN